MLQIIIIVVVIAADQLTKFLITPALLEMPGHTLPIIQDIFHLTFVKNEGASFGILQGSQIFFIVVTSIVLVVGTVYMIKTRKVQSLFLKISLSLVFSGAVGNYIDRIAFGYVRDLFDFRLINFWVFNVADACLVIGAILLGIYILFIYKEKDGKGLFTRRGEPKEKKENLED